MEACSAMLGENPRDEAAWYLKIRALSEQLYVEEADAEEEGIAEVLMDDTAIAEVDRPGAVRSSSVFVCFLVAETRDISKEAIEFLKGRPHPRDAAHLSERASSHRLYPPRHPVRETLHCGGDPPNPAFRYDSSSCDKCLWEVRQTGYSLDADRARGSLPGCLQAGPGEICPEAGASSCSIRVPVLS